MSPTPMMQQYQAAKAADQRIVTFELPSDYGSGNADHRVLAVGDAVEIVAALLAART